VEAKKRRAATLKQNQATVPERFPEREQGEGREKAAQMVGASLHYVSDIRGIAFTSSTYRTSSACILTQLLSSPRMPPCFWPCVRSGTSMATRVMKLMYGVGYPALIFLMFVENVFLPIPSELIMPLAGYMVTRAQLSFFGIIMAGTLGSVLGALPLY
jgi:hypothetical protein